MKNINLFLFMIIVIPFFLVVMLYQEMNRFEIGDCIKNEVNNKVGEVFNIQDNKYHVDFGNDVFIIPVSMQYNFKKVVCK